MSAAPPEGPPGRAQLQDLRVDDVRPNERNPRLEFPQDEIDELAQSIDQQGILVPIVVYPEDDHYVLVDGERRYKCAVLLGHEEIPAMVTTPRSDYDQLVQMFNIHLVREPWQDMPTALALKRVIEHLEATERPTTDRALSTVTGLSTEQIKRLRYVLELPEEWQTYISDHTVPLNFFWELKRNVIDQLAKQRPALFEELGGAGTIGQAFVQKRLDGVITDTVGLRMVRPIIGLAARDAGDEQNESVLDNDLRNLIHDPALSIDDVYEDTIQIMVEADKLERRSETMVRGFERLLERAQTDDEREHVRAIGKKLAEDLARVLQF